MLADRRMNRDRIFHYVNFPRIEDWLRCGWMVALPNAASHINFYGAVMEWLCDCKVARHLGGNSIFGTDIYLRPHIHLNRFD